MKGQVTNYKKIFALNISVKKDFYAGYIKKSQTQ